MAVPVVNSIAIVPDPAKWGQEAACVVDATGQETVEYQWLWHGQPIVGATSSTYTLPESEDDISTSPVIDSVTVTPDPATWGDTLTCTVEAIGHTELQYQWLYDGQPIQGATSSTYTLPASEGEIVIDAPPAPPTGLSAIIL